MTQADNFLHTTHRTVTWFNKAFQNQELSLSPPFQRNAVWTNAQKSYLMDTILNALPIPEIYMQDKGNDAGEEEHIVVDGQQRIRAVLDYLQNNYALEGDDITRQWRGLRFDDLSSDDRRSVFSYKFVVRVLPSDLREEEIRKVFSRLNKNVVALNDQEIRNATYWGPFITSIQAIADTDPYWAESGLFSATEHRRMLDQEFISELAIAYLHGPQNKKDKLDQYYREYEEEFLSQDDLTSTFRKVTIDLARLLPSLAGRRWRKKSDFYTLFIAFTARVDRIPMDNATMETLRSRLATFEEEVNDALRIEPQERGELQAEVSAYASAVARAASDRASRVARARALSRILFHEEPSQLEVGQTRQLSEEVAA